jgi:hypothetical protein
LIELTEPYDGQFNQAAEKSGSLYHCNPDIWGQSIRRQSILNEQEYPGTVLYYNDINHSINTSTMIFQQPVL